MVSDKHELLKHYIDFADFIKDKTKGFVGRKFVFDAIDKFTNKNDRGYFFVEGDPGIGKSAVAAQLVKNNDYVHHFNFRSGGRNKTRTFLANICSRLIVKYKLDYQSLPFNTLEDNAFLSKLLNEVSSKLNSKDKVVIVVDALDEVDMNSFQSGANVLFLPSDLPKKVFFVVTKREEKLNLNIKCKQKFFKVDHSSEENIEDIEKHLVANVTNNKIRSYIKKYELDKVSFIKMMSDRSKGNFMYLYYVLHEIKDGCYKDMNPDRLPQGLENYYKDHWCRMGMTAKPLPTAKIKIMYVLCEVLRYVPRDLIAKFSKEDEIIVQEVLDDWISFLHKQRKYGKPHYSIYHGSFTDFLKKKEIIQAARVDIGDIDRMIGDYLYEEWFKGELED